MSSSIARATPDIRGRETKETEGGRGAGVGKWRVICKMGSGDAEVSMNNGPLLYSLFDCHCRQERKNARKRGGAAGRKDGEGEPSRPVGRGGGGGRAEDR